MSRQEQYLLTAELRSRARAHQETFSYMRGEVEELRKTRRSEAALREEGCQDALSRARERTFWTLTCGRYVDKLTQQVRGLQEVVYTLSESQVFKDLETASGSGQPTLQAHYPSSQVFPASFAATTATTLTHAIQVLLFVTFLKAQGSTLQQQQQQQ